MSLLIPTSDHMSFSTNFIWEKFLVDLYVASVPFFVPSLFVPVARAQKVWDQVAQLRQLELE